MLLGTVGTPPEHCPFSCKRQPLSSRAAAPGGARGVRAVTTSNLAVAGRRVEPVDASVTAAISVAGLRKRYGRGADAVDALLGIDLEIAPGTIVGVLGPNGAGKTTFVEILEGIRVADAGTVRVLGASLDDPAALKARRQAMGISLQHSVLPPLLTVDELLLLQREMFGSTVDVADLVERVGLADKRGGRIGQLSGGQQQRVAVAMALVGDPRLMFLDEPTSQLDPHARRVVWEALRAQRDRGATIVITTHQMEEAQRICDWVVILDHGEVIAQGPPEVLIERYCPQRRVKFVVPVPANLGFVDDGMVCSPLPGGLTQVVVQTAEPGVFLARLAQQPGLVHHGLRELHIEQSTLEDVFIALTGREVEE